MPDRWKALIKEEPPVDRLNRNDNLWLYNAEGPDVVVHGGYVNFGDDEVGPEQEEFTDDQGNVIEVTHWTEAIPGEEPPLPPHV